MDTTNTISKPNPTSPSSYAIVIGIAGFDNLGYLAGCLNNAVAICNFLVTRVDVPPDNVRLLLAQAPQEKVGKDQLSAKISWQEKADARTATIQAAFEDIVARVRPGDQVFVYWATHGVRLVSPSGAWSYALVPQDFPRVDDLASGKADWCKLIPAAQLGHYLRALSEKASVSVIADTCHSASATRGLGDDGGARSIQVPQATEEQWQRFVAAHRSWGDLVTTEASQSGSGLQALSADRDWVCFAACRETQTAKPCLAKNERGQDVWHGVFTSTLLAQLRSTQVAVAELRWLDIQFAVRDAVVNANVAQTPVLEGRRESTVFGGKWTPFNPGYTVTVAPDGGLTVDAGVIHGLDEGAVIEIFPPGTASFAAARAAGASVAVAVIQKAEPTRSTATLQSGDAPRNQSRARLRTPSQKTPRLRVRLPAEFAVADVLKKGDEQILNVVSEGAPAQLEVRAWKHHNEDRQVTLPGLPHREGGHVLIPGDAVARLQANDELSPNDVIAYLPPASKDLDAKRIGEALRSALLHWATYQRIMDPSGKDEALTTSLRFDVLVGDEKTLQDVINGGKPPAPRPLDAGLSVQMNEKELVLLALHIKPWIAPGSKFCLGVLVASEEGNVVALWPKADQEATWAFVGEDEGTFLGSSPLAEETALAEEVKYVGWNSKPLRLSTREDQTSSAFTIKIIAATVGEADPPVDVRKMAQELTAQEVILASLAVREQARGIGGPAPEAPVKPLWYSWSIGVTVNKTKA